MQNSPPLAGIQVLALEHAIAAPLCTRQLAELGARVIKIERPGSGDFARHYDARVRGLSSHFVWTNRGKQSMTLNLKSPDAEAILSRLLPGTDVLVQNLAPFAASRLGLDFETLQHTCPRLIVCNISGYGDAGPYATRKAYDLLVQAEAGFLTVTGTANQPAKSGISIADIAAGMQAHAAILAALIQRSRTGRGSRVDISMLESMVEWMGFPLYYAYDGASPPPRTGTDHASIYPYGAFRTGSGKTVLLGLQNEREWLDFCTLVLEQPELAQDRRFVDNVSRSANREPLRQLIETCFANCSDADLAERLERAKIAWATANDMASVWDHPQLRALGRIMDTDSPAGPLKSFRPPGNNSDYESASGDIPALGQHTVAILTELGFQETDIERFRRAATI